MWNLQTWPASVSGVVYLYFRHRENGDCSQRENLSGKRVNLIRTTQSGAKIAAISVQNPHRWPYSLMPGCIIREDPGITGPASKRFASVSWATAPVRPRKLKITLSIFLQLEVIPLCLFQHAFPARQPALARRSRSTSTYR